ncbi:MAG: DUF1269 domain-containing protein [Solirubrobacterales bacterium]|nr:DUF1269 domain-containing protein [Solirubrobacterales bacterium]
MSDLVAIGYDSLATAQQVAANAAEAQQARIIELEDLVIVERLQDGKVKLHQPSKASAGALGGALWGGLIGMIFLVPFLGMAVGAASGAAAGAMSDYGVDDNFMKQLGEALQPGAAAVIFLVRRVTLDKVLPEIKIQGKVIQTSLDNATEQQLSDALAAAGRS